MVVVENLVHVENTDEIRHTYYYRLTKSDVKLDLIYDSINVQAYGIEVERQDVIDGDLVKVVRDSIECISPYRHKVHNLVKMLHENVVSPIHLTYILGEYVDEYVTDFESCCSNIATN